MSGHHHHHGHDHHHHHPVLTDALQRAFVLGIALNVVFVLVEVLAGLYTGSLALLTDAGHNLGDVGSLFISLFAFRLSKKASNSQYSYGYRKSTILASLANAVLLLVAVGGIGIEAIHRLNAPVQIPGLQVALVAGIGVLINAITAWLFFKDQKKDLNVKGAYLHMAVDAAVSVGVVISGLIMYYTSWSLIDPIISFIILLVILGGTWSLLKESLRLSLDGVPPSIDLEDISQKAQGIEGIKTIHHVHVWAISTTENAMTAHLVFDEKTEREKWCSIKEIFRHEMEHMNIQHITLETESETEPCKNMNC
jgi:cobalt-zinc-cadmium efflux system protein